MRCTQKDGHALHRREQHPPALPHAALWVQNKGARCRGLGRGWGAILLATSVLHATGSRCATSLPFTVVAFLRQWVRARVRLQPCTAHAPYNRILPFACLGPCVYRYLSLPTCMVMMGCQPPLTRKNVALVSAPRKG